MKYIKLVFIGLLILASFPSISQTLPYSFRSESIDIETDQLYQSLTRLEVLGQAKGKKIELPYLDSQSIKIEAVEVNAADKELLKKYPNIKTYRTIYRVGEQVYRGALTSDGESIYANFNTPLGPYNLRPNKTTKSTTDHYIELGVDHSKTHYCMGHRLPSQVDPKLQDFSPAESSKSLEVISNGEQFRKYRLAVVVTQSFYNAAGGSDAEVAATLVAIANALNVTYENDYSCKFIMVDPVFTNLPSTGDFDSAGNKTALAGSEVASRHNPGDYDIGHAFDTGGGGGVAQLNALCGGGKGNGYSGAYSGINTGWIQLAAHELGHMFGSPHTFSGDGGSCDDNISLGTSYEMASGITIMSYNGICGGGQNIPNNGDEDAYFHAMSLQQGIIQMNRFPSCGSPEDSGNTPPTAFADTCNVNLRIPKNTPFILRGHATDPDADALSYSWEQYDLSSGALQGDIGTAASNNTDGPLFRGYPPVGTPDRYIPPLPDVLANSLNDPFEPLPNVARDLTFRLVVRDNNLGSGAVSIDELDMQVHDSGPFEVSSPNGGEQLIAGQDFTFSWNANGANAICDNIDIRISYDGGETFDYTLASGLDFDAGSANVNIPQNILASESARIMLVCTDNTCVQFYDVSNAPVSIETLCQAEYSLICPNDSIVADEATPILNMNFLALKGAPILDLRLRTNDTDGNIPFYVWNADTTACTTFDSQNYTSEVITVSEDGDYVFRTNRAYRGTVSLFVDDTFDPTNGCGSFVSSTSKINLDDDGLVQTGFLKATLQACRNYRIVSYTATGGGLSSFADITAISGAGSVYLVDEDEEELPLVDYIYYAVNDTNGLVEAISPTGDFFDIRPGEYTIYGAAYKDDGQSPPINFDPSIWVNQSPDAFLLERECIRRSDNHRHVVVNTTCRILNIREVSRTACEPGVSQFDLTLEVEHKLSPDDGELIVNGVSFPIEPSPQLVTLSDLFSNDQMIPINAFFTSVPSCKYLDDLRIQAPANCCGIDLDLGTNLQLCEGAQEVLLNAGDDGATYEWTRDGQPLSETSNSYDVNDVQGLYKVVVRNSQSCPRSDSVLIEFTPFPTMALRGTEVICDGEISQLVATTDADSIIWRLDNSEQQAGNFLSFFADEQGLYTATAVSGFNCQTTDELFLTVNPNPVVEIGDDQVFCIDDPFSLNAGGDGVTYEWQRDGEPFAGNVAVVDLVETGDYTVNVINEFSCNTRDTVNIIFNVNPVLSLGDDDELCDGAEKLIIADGLSGSELISWFQDGFPFTPEDRSFHRTRETGEFVAISENEFNCTTADTVEIIFRPNPVVDLGDDRSLCASEDLVLDAGDDGVEYEWLLNLEELEEETMSTLEAEVSGDYAVFVTNEFGCRSDDQVSVNVVASPSVDIDIEEEIICAGESINVPMTISAFESVLTRDGDVIEDFNGFLYIATEPGEYVVTAENELDCTDSDTFNIVVAELPTVELGEERGLCTGEVETLEVAGNEASTYQWFLNGGPIVGATDSLLDVSNSGLYGVQVQTEFGCLSSDDVRINFFASPNALVVDEDFEICDGESERIRGEFVGGEFAWFRDGVELVEEQGQNLTVTEAGTYSFLVTNDFGCTAVDSVVAVVNPIPVVELANDNSACFGETLELNAGDDGVRYRWRRNAVTLDENEAVLTVTQSGTYFVTVTNEFECNTFAEASVTFFNVPDAIISDENDIVCSGQTIVLESDANAINDIQWSLDGDVIAGATTADLEVSEAGEYLLVVTNPQGCTMRDSIQVSASQTPIVELGDDQEVCSDETILLTAGTADLNYRWQRNGVNLPENGNVLDIVQTGSYAVTVTNSDGCVAFDDVQIDIVPLPTVDLTFDSELLCEGSSVSLRGSVSGGSFTWLRDGEIFNTSNISIDVTEPGFYELVAANAINCEVRREVLITGASTPVVDLGADQDLCVGDEVTLSAGSTTDQYRWSVDGNPIPTSSGTITIDESGLYSVTVTNAEGCFAVDNVDIDFVPLPEIDIVENEAVICANESFTINTNYTGSNFEWFLDDEPLSQFTRNIIVSAAGTYRFVAENSIGCESEDQIFISESALGDLDLGSDQQACAGDMIVLNAGTPGFEYAWTRDGVVLPTTSNSLEISQSGSYAVMVSDDAGCMAQDRIDIEYFDNPTVDITEEVISVCSDNVPEIMSNADGGNIRWSLDGQPLGLSTASIQPEASGQYQVIVTNSIGCEVSDIVTVNISDAPELDFGADQDLCSDDILTLDAGNAGSSYSWTLNGEPLPTTSSTIEATETGIYDVMVTTPDGCTATEDIVIRYFEVPSVMIELTEVIICAGDQYFIESNFSGDSFQWFRNGQPIDATDSDLEVDEAGTYRIEASNEIGCTVADEIIITRTNTVIEVELGDDADFCSPEEDITLNAGDPDLMYEWTRNGELISNTSNLFTVTESGTYAVVATSEDGCVANDQVTINIFEQPSVNITQDTIRGCTNDLISIDPNFVGLEFEWRRDNVLLLDESPIITVDRSGIYEFTAFNGEQCTASDIVVVEFVEVPVFEIGASGSFCTGEDQELSVDVDADGIIWTRDGQVIATDQPSIVASESGTYRAEITIGESCTATSEAILNFLDAPTIILDNNLIGGCQGDVLNVNALASTTDFTWFIDGVASSITELNFDTDVPGEYVLEVRNQADCVTRDTLTVVINDAPDIPLEMTKLGCLGSEVLLDAGTAGATYQWSRDGIALGANDAIISVDQAGSYQVLVVDQFGCSNMASTEVSFVPGPSLDISDDQSLCAGDSFTIQAETDGDNISWFRNGEMIPGQSSTSLFVSESGSYSALVLADSGCEVVDTVRIDFNDRPDVSLVDQAQYCAGSSVELITESQDSDLSYQWSLDGDILATANTSTINANRAGEYTVMVNNLAGCDSELSVMVTELAVPALSVDDTDYCEGDAEPLIIDSDAPSIQISLDGEPVTDPSPALASGRYDILATANNGCTAEISFESIERATPMPDLGIDETLCPDESTVLSAGTFESYEWSNGATTASIEIESPNPDMLTTEQFSVEVTSEFGCVGADTISVTYSGDITAEIATDRTSICLGDSLSLTASGGVIYDWTSNNGTLSNNDQSSTIAFPSQTTEYTVLVSDECPGNIDTASVTIEVFSDSSTAITADTCIILGLEIQLSASGGDRYIWTDDDSFVGSSRVPNPRVAPTETTVYEVEIIDDNGCSSIRQVEICVIDDPFDIFEPVTIFTPNEDGKNDRLIFQGLEAFPDNSLIVFDRWGSIVYDVKAYQQNGTVWDGTKNGLPLPAGTYFYVLEFEEFQIKQTLTIVRD